MEGFDEEDAPETRPADAAPRHSRRFSRRIRHAISQWAVRTLGAVLPWIYLAYCWFVWKTSRIDDRLSPVLVRGRDQHHKIVALLWHQEVFSVAYAYGHLSGHTLASTGNFGHLITQLLERCGYVVFRGGSSRGTARKRQVFSTIVRHVRGTPRLIFALTVDGSNGPAYRLKHGGPMIARSCRAPIYLCRFWCSRRIELPTWDRTVIPLPFNRIVMDAIGPYWLDPDATSEEFQRDVAHLEDELCSLSDHLARGFEPAGGAELRAGFPPGWEPWPPGTKGRRITRWDLQEEAAPPWAGAR